MLCAIGIHAQKIEDQYCSEGLQKAYLDGKIVSLSTCGNYTYPQVKFKKQTRTGTLHQAGP